MQVIKQLYRENYTGESVVSQLTMQGGEWNIQREWVPNAITNSFTTTQALVIGNGPSWQDPQSGFDLSHVARHKGGLFGTDRLQTYGTNGLFKKFSPDFLVVDDNDAKEVAQSGYTNDHIVYAHGTKIIEFPGKFYLIPQDPSWNAGSVATYMACFDGHKKIFLMGFDGVQGNDAFYEQTMAQLFKLYADVDFVRVCPTREFYMPESWKYAVNLRQITFRDFVLEADIG